MNFWGDMSEFTLLTPPTGLGQPFWLPLAPTRPHLTLNPLAVILRGCVHECLNFNFPGLPFFLSFAPSHSTHTISVCLVDLGRRHYSVFNLPVNKPIIQHVNFACLLCWYRYATSSPRRAVSHKRKYLMDRLGRQVSGRCCIKLLDKQRKLFISAHRIPWTCNFRVARFYLGDYFLIETQRRTG